MDWIENDVDPLRSPPLTPLAAKKKLGSAQVRAWDDRAQRRAHARRRRPGGRPAGPASRGPRAGSGRESPSGRFLTVVKYFIISIMITDMLSLVLLICLMICFRNCYYGHPSRIHPSVDRSVDPSWISPSLSLISPSVVAYLDLKTGVGFWASRRGSQVPNSCQWNDVSPVPKGEIQKLGFQSRDHLNVTLKTKSS
jgi:hypothetical protein